MFGRSSANEPASHHLLSQTNRDDDEDPPEMVWEQNSTLSERNISTPSELWEQDPLHDEAHDSGRGSNPGAQPPRPKRSRIQVEDHGEAASDLNQEFERIFNPVKKDQQEKAKLYGELDAACAAYSARLEEMRERQRELEGAIEQPWLAARRRREWQRFVAGASGFGTIVTCFWGGTVASLEEIPPQIAWPPPHLTRMKENHDEERRALREAHLAVVDELDIKYNPDRKDGDEEPQQEHVCVERKLLLEVLGEGEGPVATEDIDV